MLKRRTFLSSLIALFVPIKVEAKPEVLSVWDKNENVWELRKLRSIRKPDYTNIAFYMSPGAFEEISQWKSKQ
jgi:hypothetical protein